jgi:peptidoglycan/LPS O-acetylase OafA/YrhL
MSSYLAKLSDFNKYLQNHIFDFDLLLAIRGLACLSVIFLHGYVNLADLGTTKSYLFWWPFALDGSGSVLIFFVLSGYLMVKLFDIQKYTWTKAGLISFYKARINRIFPLYWFVLIFVGTLVYNSFLNPHNWLDFARTLTFMQYTKTTDFILSNHRWLMVAWSLVVEVQYYVLAPFIAFAVLKTIKFRPLIITVTVSLLLYFLYNNNWINYGVAIMDWRFQKTAFAYLPFFILGGLCVVLLQILKVKEFLQKQTWSLFLLIPIIFGIPTLNRLFGIAHFESFSNIFYVVMTCLIILVFESYNYNKKPSSFKYSIKQYFSPKTWLEIAGHLSFSAYLLHLPIVYALGSSLIFEDFKRFGISENSFFLLRFSFILFWVIVISSFTYHSIEKIQIFSKPKS